MLANSLSALKQLEVEHANLSRFGYKTQFYTQDMLGHYVPSKGYYGGVSYEDTFGINGYLYCQELKRYLQQQGVLVYEETPVVGIEGHVLTTPHAAVTASHIVMCTDRWMPELGMLTQEVYHAQTFVMMSEPLTDMQIQAIFPQKPFLVWDSDMIYTYFRITPHKRLLLGGGNLRTAYAQPSGNLTHIVAQLTRYFDTKFPGLTIQFTQAWPGLIGLSKDIAPLAGRDREKPFIYYISAAAGLPIAAALGRYSAEHLMDGRTDLDEYFSPYRSFAIGGFVQSLLGTKLSFALCNGMTKL
jgi:gamma-glutamylputrescine oxidase